MTIDLNTAIAALEALTLKALQGADDETVRKFQQLAFHWSELAAKEARDRAADLRRAKKPSSSEPSGETP